MWKLNIKPKPFDVFASTSARADRRLGRAGGGRAALGRANFFIRRRFSEKPEACKWCGMMIGGLESGRRATWANPLLHRAGDADLMSTVRLIDGELFGFPAPRATSTARWRWAEQLHRGQRDGIALQGPRGRIASRCTPAPWCSPSACDGLSHPFSMAIRLYPTSVGGIMD